MSFRIVLCLCIAFSAAVTCKQVKVMGGSESYVWYYPHLAAVQTVSGSEPICSGAIISERHVLTSGQCVHEYFVPVEELVIRAGLSPSASGGTYLDGRIYRIDQIFIHPEYADKLTAGLLYHSNLAVVRIQESFVFCHALNKVQLPTSDIRYGSIGTLAGWGKKTYDDTSPRKLRRAWMMIVRENLCENQLDMRIMVDQFCGFQTRGVGACTGDSGAPLIVDEKLVGIISLFEPCGLGIPDVYTNVYSHIEFINSILNL